MFTTVFHFYLDFVMNGLCVGREGKIFLHCMYFSKVCTHCSFFPLSAVSDGTLLSDHCVCDANAKAAVQISSSASLIKSRFCVCVFLNLSH